MKRRPRVSFAAVAFKLLAVCSAVRADRRDGLFEPRIKALDSRVCLPQPTPARAPPTPVPRDSTTLLPFFFHTRVLRDARVVERVQDAHGRGVAVAAVADTKLMYIKEQNCGSCEFLMNLVGPFRIALNVI